ncbi:hypothetical protein V500_00240 [Pseudogymnoascus sp. VKM F-4518 (FW-2643)]|nr:hypothetical protein V500_00240 [Pseudogymnoascus sp. VKM F-4518 (FW-2643)]
MPTPHFVAVLAEGGANYKQETRLTTTSAAFGALEKSREHPSRDIITFQLSAKEWREKFNAEVAIREALEIEMMGIKGENAELLTDIKVLRGEEATRTRDLEKAREALLISSHILQERALKAAEDSQKITHAATSLKLESNLLNDERATRVADLLSDFRALQHSIASIPCDPPHPDDFYTEGYAALRQCSVDGQHILNVAADTRVPAARGGQAEQEKAELSHVLLDSFSRRHEAQKICMRQSAVMRSVAWREGVLMGIRPNATHAPALAACDQALRAVSRLVNQPAPQRQLAT